MWAFASPQKNNKSWSDEFAIVVPSENNTEGSEMLHLRYALGFLVRRCDNKSQLQG
jgi:hypothetical protein